MNGEIVWITGPTNITIGGNGSGGVSPYDSVPRSKTDNAIAWLRERKRYCLDQQQPRIVPVVKPTLLDQWLAGRKHGAAPR